MSGPATATSLRALTYTVTKKMDASANSIYLSAKEVWKKPRRGRSPSSARVQRQDASGHLCLALASSTGQLHNSSSCSEGDSEAILTFHCVVICYSHGRN